MLWHLFLHLTGADNVSGPWYGFWSGFGSIVVQPAMITASVLYLRHQNCHVKGCLRLGHTDPAVHAPACKRHHTLRHLRGSVPN